MSEKNKKRKRRHTKIRAKICGNSNVPRLCIFRSLQHIYAQIINDEKSEVLLSVSDKEIKKSKATKSELAKEVGRLIAKKAAEKKIGEVVFDRGGFIFHGRIKQLAEGAREGGLKF